LKRRKNICLLKLFLLRTYKIQATNPQNKEQNMIRKALFAVLVVAFLTSPLWARTIEGNYSVKVIGNSIPLDGPRTSRTISDQTTLKVSREGDNITMMFGGFGGVSAATIFKGKTGNGHFTAVWCHQDCDQEMKVVWGSIRGNQLHGKMISPRVGHRRGMVPGWVEISFEAKKVMAFQSTDKPVFKPVRTPEHRPPHEDCLEFNPRKIKIEKETNGYLLTDGRSRMKVFSNRREARQALTVIRHYGMNQHCFIGRPNPSMEYWLADDQSPHGYLPDEDCIAFDPDKIELVREGHQWLMTDGRSRMKMFPNREEAEKALSAIRFYRFDRTCYIGRPNPSMVYFRK
jgi:hypothetical protein